MTFPTAQPAVVVARRILVAAFPDVPVASKAPKVWPARFIRVDRAGGPRDWELDRALLLVECWASTEGQAAQDADRAYAALRQCHDPAAAYFEGGSIVHFDDPDRGDFSRYQFTGTLGIRIRNT